MMRLPIVLVCVLSVVSRISADDLTVLPEQVDGAAPREMMSRYLKERAYRALERRRAAHEALKTPEELAAYQKRTRKVFVDHLGGFPERTPLNAKIVGTLHRGGYRIEKLIYESQPRHYVTAALYLPEADPPYPAVLVPCGHSRDGKVYFQPECIFLARSGIAALCYDPIGQGERYQLLDEDGTPLYRSTTEHTLVGAGCMLVGRNTATYRIWDGMRSIDYLTSREDIDPEKIGATGCSGGGTLTSYLMALDERVACAAPSCYLTSFRRLIDTIGPQDAEQNIHGQIAFGMDHADYVIMRAPRPTLILAATHDFFDIQGTWDTFREAKRFYTRLGFSEGVSLTETDTKHGYPRGQREAMVRWMRRWLVGVDEALTEPDIEKEPGSELRCTPRGQVMLMKGARSVVDLNVELAERLKTLRRKLWRANREKALAEVRRVAGIRELGELPRPRQEKAGSLERQGYRIEKMVLKTEPGIRLPALLFKPSKPRGERYLYLHGSGKHVDAKQGGPIEALALAGHLVLAVDLRGAGETGPGEANMSGGDWDDIFLAYLLGKSFVGMRAEDALVCARFLAELERSGEAARVHVVAVGAAGPPALHAASLESELFASVKLVHCLMSWTDLVRDPTVRGQMVNAVHGALRVYDLPDLVGTIPRGQVTVEDPLNVK